jgi:hypothetical protein
MVWGCLETVALKRVAGSVGGWAVASDPVPPERPVGEWDWASALELVLVSDLELVPESTLEMVLEFRERIRVRHRYNRYYSLHK